MFVFWLIYVSYHLWWIKTSLKNEWTRRLTHANLFDYVTLIFDPMTSKINEYVVISNWLQDLVEMTSAILSLKCELQTY